jgi:hypothetical protein
LRDFDSLFKGRLKLDSQGTSTQEGRTAWKYAVSLAAAEPQNAGMKLPPLAAPRSGRDPSTERRLRFYEKRNPKGVSGDVWIDGQTSVVLRAKLDGRMTAPGDKEGGDADLHVTVDVAVHEIGKEPVIKAPVDFLPDVDKPEGIAEALDRFGIPRAGKHRDGGAEAEPDDEGS